MQKRRYEQSFTVTGFPRKTGRCRSGPAEPGPLYVIRQSSPLFGDAAAAVTAAQTLAGAGVPFQLLQENAIRPSVLRGHNVLVIGAPNYSSLTARVLAKAPFSIRNDPNSLNESITFTPSDGKTPGRSFSATGMVYGLITIFPSAPTSESVTRTVIVSGIRGSGTQAAMEFFCSPLGLRSLKERFKKDGLASMPASYQVVVQGSLDQSGSLMNWRVAAYQTMDPRVVLE
jgi:hypothetical protein